jgi:hypothetical protein
MSKFESTRATIGRTTPLPQQRGGRTRTVPRQRVPRAPARPTRFDVFGNPLDAAPPTIVLQNTTYTSGRAIASLVLGVLSMALGGPILGVPAMLLSMGADREISRSHGVVGGRASARVGFWTGVVGSLLGVYTFFLLLTLVGFSISIPLPAATR